MRQPLDQLVDELREARGIGHKQDIRATTALLAVAGDIAIRNGDDCAAILQADGSHLLLAIEGFINEFVDAQPWFAGWCGVMVNLSDIAAMGGRPLAVVDALWSRGAEYEKPILQGLAAAAQTYGVPIVGGHTNSRNARGEQLAVSILGRATTLLTSFDAHPGDRLIAAIDLRGAYHEPYNYWDAATRGAPAERLRGDLELLPEIAEAGLCRAAKDISMAGLVGTALMLLECSGLGAALDVSAVPRPTGVPLGRWLQTFPSFGFLLAAPPAQVDELRQRFECRDIACAEVGICDDSRLLKLTDETGNVMPFRDLESEPLMGFCNRALDSRCDIVEIVDA
jgi:AIR synthase-related protein